MLHRTPFSSASALCQRAHPLSDGAQHLPWRSPSLTQASWSCAHAKKQVAGNAISGSIDLSTLLPRYVNGARGPFIVAIVGFAVCPWEFLNTANAFISVLSGFSIFLGPLAGIMMADYFLIRRQTLKLSDLYRPDSSSIYWFNHGFNPRAFVVWALAVFPCLPGWLNSVSSGSIKVSIGWVHVSYLGWLLGASSIPPDPV